MKYGLIGEKLPHSFSKEIHEKIGGYDYEICEIEKDRLDEFMIKREFCAINVTIPYKELVIPHLHYIDPVAEKIGAVNTVVNKNGLLYGYNTDFYGLSAMIRRAEVEIENKTVLIFGTGGTAKTARFVAEAMGAEKVLTVSRSRGKGDITYEEAPKMNAQVIINTTPVGMFPDTDAMPDDLSKYSGLCGVIDVIYNPLKTKLVRSAEKMGIKTSGGLYMLVAQAIFASGYFFDRTPEESVTEKIYSEILKSKQNIVLTGMPGSGKTTVGRILAEKLGRELVDTDELIVEKYGEITEIFKSFGEEHFRKLESEAVAEVSKRSGIIIATGGGAVLKEENIENLKANGIIFFIDRSLEEIMPTGDRPLSSDFESLKRRYEERYETYCKTADVHIISEKTAEATAEKVVKG